MITISDTGKSPLIVLAYTSSNDMVPGLRLTLIVKTLETTFVGQASSYPLIVS